MSTKQTHIDYWLRSAHDDLEAVGLLFDGGKYLQALFFTHLTLEKVLKAHWIKNNTENIPPKTHNLTYLYSNTGIELSDDKTTFLQMMNVYQLEGRYPTYITQLNISISQNQTESIIENSKKLFKCLVEMIQ